MGDPTQPGDDQETTIIIEGPPANPGKQHKQKQEDFDNRWVAFKRDVRALFAKYPEFNMKVRNIKYMKKSK